MKLSNQSRRIYFGNKIITRVFPLGKILCLLAYSIALWSREHKCLQIAAWRLAHRSSISGIVSSTSRSSKKTKQIRFKYIWIALRKSVISILGFFKKSLSVQRKNLTSHCFQPGRSRECDNSIQETLQNKPLKQE